jgi:hypothetical protein
VSDEFGVIVPDMANGHLEIVTVESLNASLGIRPAQVPSFLALTEGGKQAIFTKGQAVRVLAGVYKILVSFRASYSCGMLYRRGPV